MNLFHACNLEDREINTYFIDSLSLFDNFKMVYGFCPYVPEIIKKRVLSIHEKALFFNLGNMKAGGIE
jgi:hypothetical protein